MSTARLTWIVLDRLVPSDEVAVARAALIARDPELQSLMSQGVMSETEALEALRSRQNRYGDTGRAPGNGRSTVARWAKRMAAMAGTGLVVTTVLHLAH